MYMKIMNVDEFVKNNSLKQITNPIFLEHGRPTPDGLFSYEIFGITPSDRRNIWAYIDLGEKFLHPLAAINLRRYSKVFENLMNGLKSYRFVDGFFVEDPLNGETGIDYLYQYYDKIEWKKTESFFPAQRIKFLSQPKEKLFLTKFPVSPPFYRDINEGSVLGVHEVNDKYKTLISQTKSLTNRTASFKLFGDTSRAIIQRTLNEIFEYYILAEYAKKKTGTMRDSVIGINVDRSIRLVISANKIEGETYKDMHVDFEHTGMPLHGCIAIGYEFVMKGLKDFFMNEFVRSGKYPYLDENNQVQYLNLVAPELEFSEEKLAKRIKKFVNSPSSRFDSIPIPKNKQGIEGNLRMVGVFNDSTVMREMTWTDLFFIICNQTLGNKYIMATRYPIEDDKCVFYSKIAFQSTSTTVKATVNGITYDYYPAVEVGNRRLASCTFVDTMSPSNLYLSGIGGDFDGDMLTIRLVWTGEGNADAEKYVKSIKNLVSLMGGTIRTTERDFIQGMYALTVSPEGFELIQPPKSKKTNK